MCCLAAKSQGRLASGRLCTWLSSWLPLAFFSRTVQTLASFGKHFTTCWLDKLSKTVLQPDHSQASDRAHHVSCLAARSRFSISIAVTGCCTPMSENKLGEKTNTVHLAGLSYTSQLCFAQLVRCSQHPWIICSLWYKRISKGHVCRQQVSARQGSVKPADREELLSSPEAPHDEPGRLLWLPDPPDRPAQILQWHCWSCVRRLPGWSAAPPAHTQCWLSGTPAGPRQGEVSVISVLWAQRFEQTASSMIPLSFPPC